MISDGPAHDFLGIAINHGSQVDEALPGMNVGNVLCRSGDYADDSCVVAGHEWFRG